MPRFSLTYRLLRVRRGLDGIVTILHDDIVENVEVRVQVEAQWADSAQEMADSMLDQVLLDELVRPELVSLYSSR